MARKPTFSRSVFINCPFDDDYTPLFEAIIFTLLILDFTPRSALEVDDGSVRLNKIRKIIGECKFGIHDISRTELDSVNNLPRFNMPFELGLDLACKYYSADGTQQKKKVHMILDTEEHRFRKYLSDISGLDIKAHEKDAHRVIRLVRDWLRPAVSHLPSATGVIEEYELFLTQIKRVCTELALDHDGHSFVDYGHIVSTWLNQRKASAT